jgi:type I restriction enzyme S subunit
MSGVNFLEKLLDGAAVEWKTVSEIFDLKNGYTPSTTIKEFWESGSVPWFRMDDIRENGQILNDSLQKISESAVKGGKLFPANSIIIATSATIGEHALITVPYLANQRFTNLSLKDSYVEKFDIKFIFYYCFLLADWCKKNITMSSFASVDMNGFKKFPIPIPCPENPDRSLAIQAEIVRILDTFTALTAELTAELSDRKKQYNYYRDRLLTFEEGEVEWKTLGEVALDFGRGKSKHRPRNDPKLYGGNTPFIQTGDIRNASHIIETYSQTYSEIGLKQSKLWSKGTLCITIAANIAETSILGFDACFPDSVIGFVANPEKTTSGYVEYLLSSLKTKLEEMGQGSAQSNINLGTFENLRLPFPPLAEQVRIASLLDKFDTLTHSIREGLPREIALRQKQYEYYRDLLLTFPKTTEEQ